MNATCSSHTPSLPHSLTALNVPWGNKVQSGRRGILHLDTSLVYHRLSTSSFLSIPKFDKFGQSWDFQNKCSYRHIRLQWHQLQWNIVLANHILPKSVSLSKWLLSVTLFPCPKGFTVVLSVGKSNGIKHTLSTRFNVIKALGCSLLMPHCAYLYRPHGLPFLRVIFFDGDINVRLTL